MSVENRFVSKSSLITAVCLYNDKHIEIVAINCLRFVIKKTNRPEDYLFLLMLFVTVQALLREFEGMEEIRKLGSWRYRFCPWVHSKT